MASGFAQWGNDLHTGRKSYNIVGRRRTWYGIAILAVLASVLLLSVKGLNPGIEFRGGSQFTISGASSIEQQPAIDAVASIAPAESPRVSSIGSSAVRVQTAELTTDEVAAVRDALAVAYDVPVEDVASSFIGPSWGADVSSKAITGLIVFLVLVSVVMTIYFRAWRMAAAALIALGNDLILTVGVYALIGWEVTPATAIGFLTILGYSIYDTVVVFDKVRENTAGVLDQSRSTYAELANLAVNQTLVRSINTSVVALLPVSAILFVGTFILGAGTLRDISLALFVGMFVGTFSSIFLATPLEVTFREREPRMLAHTKKIHELRAAAAAVGTPTEAGALAGVAAYGAHLLPGQHQGTAAQPKRRKSGKK
ncbi:protein translocase subunit SecF [Pengzhenrongella frigida]|uniref:Protein-export membrane protein SecF n=1 Tax=Pengzhenrongella frigida TaxID=1259133 RepID=A0A4Q5N722_9MICO|nr:protein translocase subunit SecF [Cellulomonas sp. HLT2-17]RYV52847.1 protein translocase subunit SecF [Cellulomonas sp. HLT2-17]